MDLIHPQVGRYLANLARSSDPVLEEMERLASIRSFPIVGPQVGALLHVLASSIGARSVLELGSGFGYSAQWFARAVGPTGRVVLIEVGDALEIGETLEGPFDIVFNDIDKQDYPAALDVAGDRLREGGLFISDNMLWQGNVLEPETNDAATRGVLELTRRLYASDAWITTLLPLRDGVTISLKQG